MPLAEDITLGDLWETQRKEMVAMQIKVVTSAMRIVGASVGIEAF